MNHLTKKVLFKDRNDIEAGTTKYDVICLLIYFIVSQYFSIVSHQLLN